MKTVFISREQSPDSIFHKTLTSYGLEVTGQSLIQISPVPFSDFPETDWVFFYSKNGVKHFFDQLQKPLPHHTRLAAIGPGTADFLKLHFAAPDFIGDGNAETTAKSFLQNHSIETILFPRAKTSQRSVQKWLDGHASSFDLVVYENSPLQDFEMPTFDYLVFTSPMNAMAYLGKKKILKHQSVLAIGTTTAQYLKNTGIANIAIAATPTEASLAESVIGLEQGLPTVYF